MRTPLVVLQREHEAQPHTPSLSAASWLLQPSTGILMLSTVGSNVCGTVMAREIIGQIAAGLEAARVAAGEGFG